MKYTAATLLLIFAPVFVKAQDVDTFLLHYAVSNRDTIAYKRVIQFDKKSKLYHVQDYFENGQIQMEGFYSSFDKHIKEEYQCNYRSNTKEGLYQEWYENGQLEFAGNFAHGLLNGPGASWYENGQKEAEQNWVNGQLHGSAKYWTINGDLQFDLTFSRGQNQNPKEVTYPYLSYLPKAYDSDTLKLWPLILYLHGGSARGHDLKKLYASGIPDQLYRGREFPFIIIAPQCPEHIRWSTDHWFENLFKEITLKYRIDTNRVYLTGASMGGSGTWYLAAKYPDQFAAIAPICGFTSQLEYIDIHIDKLMDMPLWAFHGKTDNVVPFEETERIIKKLEGKNKNVRFTMEPDAGHGIQWLVYPHQALYDWFLKYNKKMKNR